MNAVIADPEALRALSPRDLGSYLQAKRWRQADVRNGTTAIWLLAAEAGEFEIEQRLDAEIGDYALRTAEALHTLSVVERRSQTEIYRDVTEAADDVLRVPLRGPGSGDGTLPLSVGAAATDRLREMVEAAACAEIDARAAYGPRKPSEVAAYVDSVRLGQTEVGSFVLTMLSPLPPLGQLLLPGAEDPDLPFARRVMMRLSEALDALKTATAVAAARDLEEAFKEAVPRGVSANLCQAVSGLARAAGGRLEARFSWGHAWPVKRDAISTVTLSASAAEIAGEAARWLRERAPRSDFELEGAVVRLARPEEAVRGTVTVRTPVEGQWRSVQMTLGEEDLGVAVRAFESRSLFAAIGELVRERGGYVLRHPRDVHELRDV